MTISDRTPAEEAVETVDGEHAEQIALLDALLDSVRQAASVDGPREILDQVTNHCRVHFLSEQLLMRLHAYPDYEGHVAVHDRLIEAFDNANQCLADESLPPDRVLATVEAVRVKLLNHIRTQDEAFHRWLPRAGIGSKPARP